MSASGLKMSFAQVGGGRVVEDSDHEDPRPIGPGWPATMVVGGQARVNDEGCLQGLQGSSGCDQ